MATTKAPAAKTRRELRDIAKEMIIGDLEAMIGAGWSADGVNTDDERSIVEEEMERLLERVKKMLGRA